MIAANTSLGFTCAFLALLLLLHFLKPELDPGWRWISEYEIGRFGWMMRVAFFCWGAGVLALAIALRDLLQSVPGVLGGWWLVAISVALWGAGIFKTDPITDQTSSRENVLHAICGAVVILTFPVAASLVAAGLSHDVSRMAGHFALLVATALTWVGLVVFLASDVVAGRRSPSEGRVANRGVRVGWQNRFMVLTYVTWIISVSASVLRP